MVRARRGTLARPHGAQGGRTAWKCTVDRLARLKEQTPVRTVDCATFAQAPRVASDLFTEAFDGQGLAGKVEQRECFRDCCLNGA